jgi:signal transduction histidine kinase
MKRLWVQFSISIGMIVTAAVFLFIGLFLLVDWQLDHYDDDKDEGMDDIGGLATRSLFIITASGVIGVACGVYVSRTLIKPISQLAEAATAIGAGNLDQRVYIQGSQELMDLAETFNRMAMDIQQAEELRKNLMADVSHELRTPLTVLEGNLRAALDHVYELDEAEIANLCGQTCHLIQLVNDLHELAQAEAHQLPLNKQQVDITPLLRDVFLTFELPAEDKQVSLVYQTTHHLPSVCIDESRIRQVLHNLLANALRHTPPGGRIVFRSEFEPHEIRITVEDTGAGIPPEHTAHVFDRFYRVDGSRSRETGGSGLGLAIVKAIIEEHQGQVTVYSDGVDQGSTVTIHLRV